MNKLPDFKYSKEDIDYLLSAKAIRDKAKLIYEKALEGKTNFSIDENNVLFFFLALKKVSIFLLICLNSEPIL